MAEKLDARNQQKRGDKTETDGTPRFHGIKIKSYCRRSSLVSMNLLLRMTAATSSYYTPAAKSSYPPAWAQAKKRKNEGQHERDVKKKTLKTKTKAKTKSVTVLDIDDNDKPIPWGSGFRPMADMTSPQEKWKWLTCALQHLPLGSLTSKMFVMLTWHLGFQIQFELVLQWNVIWKTESQCTFDLALGWTVCWMNSLENNTPTHKQPLATADTHTHISSEGLFFCGKNLIQIRLIT